MPLFKIKVPCDHAHWINSEYINLRNRVFKAKSKADKGDNSEHWHEFKQLRNKLNLGNSLKMSLCKENLMRLVKILECFGVP